MSKTINHLGISGGKDSTALLLWAVYESGYPLDSIVASFCDTGNEHQWTYDHIKLLDATVHPIQIIKPPLDFWELAHKKQRFPARKARFCTQELKMKPTQAFVQGLSGDGAVLLHSGVRASESNERAKLSEHDWDSYMALPVYRPLLRWSLQDVWEIHERYGVPKNKLYETGMHRVGCFPCINSNKAEIRLIAEKFPDRIAFISNFERTGFSNRKVGFRSFFHSKTVTSPFRSIPFKSKDGSVVMVCTIHDVVAWSKTEHGGKQYSLPLEYEMPEDRYVSCPSSLGMCE